LKSFNWIEQRMKIRELPCFQHVHWRPSKTDLRGFVVAMPVGAAAAGAVLAWRSGGITPAVETLWGAGLALALAALVPGLGRAAYLAVFVPASVMGYLISTVVLTGAFFLVFVPFGLVLRIAGRDALSLRPPPRPGGWRAARALGDRAGYYRQF
jgi:hypothetical protein